MSENTIKETENDINAVVYAESGGVPAVITEPYENKSRHSFAEVLAFNLYVIRKPRRMILFAGVFILFMGALIVALSENEVSGPGYTWLGASMLAMGATFVVIALMFKRLTFKNVKKLEQSSGIIGEETYIHFSFGEEFFKSKTTVKNKKIEETDLDYSRVFKTVEDRDLLYIFISSNQALLLVKNSMLNCEFEQFKSFLKRKMRENGKPFEDCMKNK
jgi:hypothetical protein